MKSSSLKKVLLISQIISFYGCRSPQAAIKSTASSAPYSYSMPELYGDRLFNKSLEFKTLDEFLGSLPPEAFKDHVLVYNSLSLQDASYEKPRVLVPFQNAVIAFTGSEYKKDPSKTTLEILTVSKDDHIEAVEISYDLKGLTAPTLERPENCQNCHRYDLRPNFERYFLWPGFYGSQDDNYTYSPPQREIAGYKKYLGTRASQIKDHSGPYRFLPEHKSLISGTQEFQERYNLRFLNKMTDLNERRIVATMKPMRDLLVPYRQLIAATMCAKENSSPFRKKIGDVRMKKYSDEFKNIALRTLNLSMNTDKKNLQRHIDLVGLPLMGRAPSFEKDHIIHDNQSRIDQIVRGNDSFTRGFENGTDNVYLQFVLERLIGLDLSHWSAAFDHNYSARLVNASHDTFPLKVRRVLLELLFENYNKADPKYEKKLCDTIENDLSEDAIDKNFASLESTENEPENPVFGSCVGCHDSDAIDAPYIPMRKASLMTRYLQINSGLGRDIVRRITSDLTETTFHMPPTHALNDVDKKNITDFITRAQK